MQWLMLRQPEPKDYVIATGRQHSVRDFVHAAAGCLDIQITWQGEGVDEEGVDQDGRGIVAVDPRYYRPPEVEALQGDASRAKRELNWHPRTTFVELVREMTEEDLQLAEKDALATRHGYTVLNSHER
jgi:GDPmannose 4,6-dehydratase